MALAKLQKPDIRVFRAKRGPDARIINKQKPVV
jgi:hypothetical protein